jgi:hypothetical protein
MVPAAGGKNAYPSCAVVQGPDGGVEVDFVPEGVREGGSLGHRRGDGRLEEFHGTWGGRAVVRYRVPWGCTALGRPVRVVVAGCFWFKKEAIADEGNLLSRRLLGALNRAAAHGPRALLPTKDPPPDGRILICQCCPFPTLSLLRIILSRRCYKLCS